MPRKPSYDDLKTDRDRLDKHVLVLSIAHCDKPDATFTHRHNSESYKWSAYRLAGAAGGYVICKFRSPHNHRPAAVFIGTLDELLQLPFTVSNEDGHGFAATAFNQLRHQLHAENQNTRGDSKGTVVELDGQRVEIR